MPFMAPILGALGIGGTAAAGAGAAAAGAATAGAGAAATAGAIAAPTAVEAATAAAFSPFDLPIVGAPLEQASGLLDAAKGSKAGKAVGAVGKILQGAGSSTFEQALPATVNPRRRVSKLDVSGLVEDRTGGKDLGKLLAALLGGN